MKRFKNPKVSYKTILKKELSTKDLLCIYAEPMDADSVVVKAWVGRSGGLEEVNGG